MSYCLLESRIPLKFKKILISISVSVSCCMFPFSKGHSVKVPSLKEVNFGKVKLWDVEHFLSSLLGVIATVFSNHAQK